MLSPFASRTVRVVPLALALLLVSPASPQICTGPVQITTASPLPSGTVGAAYSQVLTATYGGSGVTWGLASGSLPGGLTLSGGGAISGTPTAAGTFNFVVAVTVSGVCEQAAGTAQAQFALTVSATSLAVLASPPPLAGATGVPYSQTLAARCGTLPYTWALTAGALPAGLALSSAGVIAGTPTAAGTSTFTATVTDAKAAAASGSFSLSIAVGPLNVSTPSPLPPGVAGTAYSQALTAGGGYPPYTWSVTSGSLPPLLTLGPTGVIAGTPTTPGAWSFTVSVTDTTLHFASQTLTLDITLGPLTVTSPATLPPAVTGSAYSQSLTASGGAPPYSWQIVSGSWPAGLVFSTSGAISGAPTAAGTYPFSARVTDSASETATQTFALTVAAAGTLTRVGVISQVAAGGGWDTTIWLVNRSSAPVQASVVFHGDDGGALTLPFTVTQPGFSQQVNTSSVQETIAPNTMLTVATGAAASSVQGWADVLASGAVSGFALFRYAGGSEAAAPLESQLGTSISLPFDNAGGYSTGVALANLSGFQANITASVWDQYGNQIVTQQPITLSKTDPSGDGHDAFMLTDRLPVTAGTRGIVQFQSNPLTPTGPVGQLAGLGLRAGPTGAFTSLPTIAP